MDVSVQIFEYLYHIFNYNKILHTGNAILSRICIWFLFKDAILSFDISGAAHYAPAENEYDIEI